MRTHTIEKQAQDAIREAALDVAVAVHRMRGVTTFMVERSCFETAAAVLRAAGLDVEPLDFDGPDTHLAAGRLTSRRRVA